MRERDGFLEFLNYEDHVQWLEDKNIPHETRDDGTLTFDWPAFRDSIAETGNGYRNMMFEGEG